jgi:hypothetical protein
MSSQPVSTFNEVKYLGVIIDEMLSFDSHIVDICSRANKTLLMLMRNLKKARTKTRLLAYKTLCRPKLEYASHTWSPHLLKHKNLIEAINRKAFRWCFCYRKYDSISHHMFANNWPTLETRRADRDLDMYMRILSDQAAVDKDKYMPHQSEQHDTRHGATKGVINTDVKKFFFQNRPHYCHLFIIHYYSIIMHKLTNPDELTEHT